MANKIKVRRGTDVQRTGATTLEDHEIHYSTANAGDGRPERLCVADSSAGAHANSGDVLIGPFRFEGGASGRIVVNADYQTGQVVIDYQDAATYSPSSSLTAVASTYSNNASVEAGDTFTGPHTISVAKGSGGNEVLIDRASVTYLGSTTNFASPLNAVDGATAATGSLSWSQSIPTPANFSIGNIADRRAAVTVTMDPAQGSGFSADAEARYFNFGWRVRGFVATTQYSSLSLPNSTVVTGSGSQFNDVVQTPTTAFTKSWTLPSGSNWYLYFLHSCSPDGSPGSITDEFGWTPTFTLVGSGQVGFVEVTDLAEGDLYQTGTGGNVGGQSAAKTYRLWRSPFTYAGGQTITLQIS